MAALHALLSHWRRHPVQLAMLLAGLAAATALWSGVQAINAEARASYDRAAALLGQDRYDRITRADGGRVSDADYIALRRAGWNVTPVIEARLAAQDLSIIGIDPLTRPRDTASGLPAATDAGTPLRDFLLAPGLLLVAGETAARLDPARLPPFATDAGLPPGTAVTDIGTAKRLLAMPDTLTYLLVTAPSPRAAPLETIAPALQLRPPDPESDLSRLTDSFHLNLTAFGFLAFAVGLFIVHSVIGLAFEQRLPMFRTLRALGVSARKLILLALAELLVLALLAGAAGLALGYVVAAALLPDVAATLDGLYGADLPGTLTLRPTWVAAGLAIAVAGTLAAAAQSLWRLWHLPLLAPAQPREWARASARALRLQGLAGAALFVAALALLLGGSSLWAGFGVLAGLLLGAALLLPLVLTALTRTGQRAARGALAQWFWADTRQQLPGLSLALMALLLALAANIGVGTMVSSFRLTFTGWLDQRLASELYVTARTPEEAARLQTWLAPRTDAILPIVRVEAALLGRPGAIFGVADHATYRLNWPLLRAAPDVWDRLAQGSAILVNEQLARSAGLGIGDSVDLPGGALPVAGVYSDYGNPSPQVMIGLAALSARFPDTPHLRFALRLAPDRAEDLALALSRDFGLPAEAIVDQAAVKAASLGIFERTFAVTAALNVLTLGVAGLAMFASLLTLATLRLPQLAPVWAVGLTRRHLAGLDLLRGLVLAGLTLVLALPLGLALAWVLLAVVNVRAFGWRLPMHVFPSDWLWLAALAFVAAAAAALLPAFRLARMAPADLLRVFANER